MATSTRPDPKKTDRYGIERVTDDDPGFVDKMRMKYEWFDHIMRMQERYSQAVSYTHLTLPTICSV